MSDRFGDVDIRRIGELMQRWHVRIGEPTEAICYKHARHPCTEIAAQRGGKAWHIFYVSSRTVFTIKSFRGDNEIVRSVADIVARAIAMDCLHRDSPSEHARNALRS